LGLSCRAVLTVIVAKGGATIAEIARELATDKSSISGRIANLRDDLKMIEDSGHKRASTSPVPGIVWRPTEAGRNALQDRPNVLHAPTMARVPAEVTAQPDLFSR
jgi:DNA-binding MarR family transcriptional regulator